MADEKANCLVLAFMPFLFLLEKLRHKDKHKGKKSERVCSSCTYAYFCVARYSHLLYARIIGGSNGDFPVQTEILRTKRRFSGTIEDFPDQTGLSVVLQPVGAEITVPLVQIAISSFIIT